MFVALAITPSGTNEHVFDRSCLDAAWNQPVGHATCLMTPAEPATFAEWPFVWRMRIMSLLRHLETRCTIQPNVVGQTWRSKGRERGAVILSAFVSCQIKKEILCWKMGANGEQSWLLRLASEPWQLDSTWRMNIGRISKTQLNHAFGTENATQKPKKKVKQFQFQFQWDWNQKEHTNQLPSPCRLLQRF